MRRLRRRIVPFALAAGLVLGPASAASAVGWLPTQTVPLVAGDVDVDASGNAVVVGRSGSTQVQASTRTIGGAWTPPALLSTADDSFAQKPLVSVDPRGNAVAVWSAYSAEMDRRVVRVANRPAGGVWSVPFRLSQHPTSFGTDYAIATDRQGMTTVAWTELESDVSSTYILRVVSRPGGGSWATAIPTFLTTSGDGSAFSPDVAVNNSGAATVSWVGSKPAPGGGTVDVVRARSRDVSWGAWTPAEELSPGKLVVNPPQVVVDGDGDSTVVWSQNDPSATVRAIRRTAEGNWGATKDVGAGEEPQIALAPDGTRTVVWVGPALGGSEVRASHDTGSGTWSPAATLASSASATDLRYPHVATDGRGDVTAIWGRFDGPSATAEVTRRIGGRPWSDEPDLAVGNLGDYPVGAIDPRGNVTLIWTTATTTPAASSVFDPAAPDLDDNVLVPASVTAGQAFEVEAAPDDASPVTIAWDFGDGHTASGPSATHSYATAGLHTMTITATDAVGNVAQATRTVAVGPGGTKGPPPPPESGPKVEPTPVPLGPVLSGLQQTSARWTTKKRRGSRVPVGTSFRFRLDRAAKVRLDFGQIVPGRRSGKSCVKATKKNRSKRSCDRVEARGTVNAFGKAGANGVEFRGKIGRRTLKPGRYRVQVTATADGKTSKAVTKTFTIVR